MREVLVFRYGHSHGYAYTVVGSKRGAFCLHPFAVNPCLDRVFKEVMYGIGCFLRDHIHVSLDDDSTAVLVSRSGRNPYDDVAGFISDSVHITLFGPFENVLAYCFFVL